MSLPVAPFHLQVSVATPRADAAVTGRSAAAVMAAAMAAATTVAVSPTRTPMVIRWPAMYSGTVPAAVAVPTTVMVPVAATPAASSAAAMHQSSPKLSFARYLSTMRASMLPRPNRPIAWFTEATM